VTTVGAIELRLANLRHEAAGEHRGARTNVVELVVWAGNNDLADWSRKTPDKQAEGG